MRLTLRTMLAYLDEVRLAPEDAQELAAKIEESEFATGLVHRIRSATRQLRLSAPRIDAKGMGLDANTVAEYLDNVLAEERIADFERVCLESDVHLAEVASCHQILTLVLGMRAEVDPALRDKIYALPDTRTQPRPEAAAEVEAPGNGQPESSAEPVEIVRPSAEPQVVRPSVEVPDYLKAARRSSWKPALATAVLALILVTAALMALGDLNEQHPVLGPLFRSFQTQDVADAGPAPATEPGAANPSPGEGQAAPPPASAPAGPAPEPPPSSTSPAATSPAATSPAEPPSPASDSPTSPADASPPTPPPGEALAANDTSPARAPEAGTTAAAPVPPVPADDVPRPGTTPPGLTVPPLPASDIGRYIGSERRHVLARYDQASQNWYRLPEREVLRSDDKLLVLPSYRPQLALTSGVQCMIVGPSYVEFSARDATSPTLALESSNVLFDTAGVAGTQISLSLARRLGVLTFVTPDATVAVSVARPFPLGQDPGTVATTPECRLMATSGQLLWAEPDQAPVTIQGGQELRLVAGMAPELRELGNLPAWIQGADLREIELRASRELETMIASQRPLALSLAEQVGHRQIEVASLAAASLCALGEFEPAWLAFRSERHSAYWRSLLEALQTALVSQPQAPARIQAMIEKLRPEDSAVLYRLLLGFNNDQLAAGDDARLVSMLEHRAVDVRVLAFENLRHITDRTHLYRPEKDPSSQRRPLQDWRTTLGKGEVRWPTN